MTDLRPVRLVALILAALVVGLLPAVSASAGIAEDTLSIIKDDETSISNAELAARLSDATFTSARRVLIGRDDQFADAMTSGVLQGDSPLLLVPRDGPVPERTLLQLEVLDPDEVMLLGGSDALSPAVAEQLDAAGYTVTRTFGPSRIETATSIADLGAAASDTVLIARAFSDPNVGDPTQAFADALAAGGWSASSGWPILLTETEVLTGSTRAYLASHDVEDVFILGGTAAVSAGVEAELASLVPNVERVAGSNRFGTAIEIADKRGAQSASDVARVTLVDGQLDDAWAGGFAAAGHSSRFEAPIVLSSGGEIPPETFTWLSSGVDTGSQTFTGVDPDPTIVLTCVTAPAVCQLARQALGLEGGPPPPPPPPPPGSLTLTFDPPSGTSLTAGQSIMVSANSPVERLDIDGSCVQAPTSAPSPATVVPVGPGACDLVVTPVLSEGPPQEPRTATYVVQAPEILFIGYVPESDRTLSDVWMVGADGSDPHVAFDCEPRCRDLRVSADQQQAVVVVDDLTTGTERLVLFSAPDFDTPVTLVEAAPNVSYDLPQFVPDGSAVVVNRNDVGTNDVEEVVRVDLADRATTTLATDMILAGTDAVGMTSAVPGGVGALLVDVNSAAGSPSVTTDISVIDVYGDGMQTPAPLSTAAGSVYNVAISPGGTAYAYGSADDRVVVGFLDGRPELTTPLDLVLRVNQLVWASQDIVQGLAHDPASDDVDPDGHHEVTITVGTDVLAVTEEPTILELNDPGRPGPYEGSLLAQLGEDLVLTEDPVRSLATVGVDVVNPHVLQESPPANAS